MNKKELRKNLVENMEKQKYQFMISNSKHTKILKVWTSNRKFEIFTICSQGVKM